MRTLITNGTIVTADGSYPADVLDRRRDDRRDRRRPGRRGRDGRRDDRRDRQVRDPGRHRRPHPHGAAVRRHVRQGHVRDRAPARPPSAARPRSSTSPSSTRGQSLREGLDTWHAKAEGNAVTRLRLPHDHERRQRRHARGDGPARRRGRAGLQAVHRLPGRLLQRRRRDLPGDAADRRRTAG